MRFMSGEYGAALEQFRTILKERPKDINSQWLVTLCLWRLQRYEEASGTAMLVLSGDPLHRYARLVAGLCAYQTQDWHKVFRQLAVSPLIGTILSSPKINDTLPFLVSLLNDRSVFVNDTAHQQARGLVCQVLFSHYQIPPQTHLLFSRAMNSQG